MSVRKFKIYKETVGELIRSYAERTKKATPNQIEHRLDLYFCPSMRLFEKCERCDLCAAELRPIFDKMVEPGVREPLGRLVTQIRLHNARLSEELNQHEVVMPSDEWGRPMEVNPFERYIQ